LEKLGSVYGPQTATIDAARAQQYADATNDPNPRYRDGSCAPPVFGVVPTFASMGLVVADVVPSEALMLIVHGEHDMHFHRPLVPGATLVTRCEPHSVRVGGSGTRLAVRAMSDDESGSPVLEQLMTVFVRGMTDGESGGPDAAGHDFPEEARAAKVGELGVHVDDDQTYRYRDASGDEMPIHVDEAVAKAVGLPGIIAHGLCTMAMCSQAVVQLCCDGDPARLRRLAVRFAANVFPGNDVLTEVFDVGDRGGRHLYAFEATSAGAVVIKNGLAEIDA
jgi:acyl dehydratase